MSWWSRSSSDDSSLFTSSDEEEPEPVEQGMGANPFLDGNDSDSDDERRIVRTAKEKRFEELLKTVKKIRSSVRLHDWVAISEGWTQAVNDLTKGKVVIDKYGVPKFFISLLCALNDFIDKTYDNKDLRKNMKSQTAKAFNNLRLKFKKFLKEDPLQRQFQEKMEVYKSSGKSYEITSQSEDEEEDIVSDEGHDDNNFFQDDFQDDGEKLTDIENEKWTQDKVDKKIRDLLSKRGTKYYNKREHLKIFKFLKSRCEGLNHKLILDFHIVTLLFDMTHSGVPMSTVIWIKVYNILTSIVEQLINNPQLKLYESKEELLEDVKEENHNKLPSHVVTGVLIYSLERLGDEYNQSLQTIEAPSEQYLIRLSHENALIRLLQLSQNFYLSHKDFKRASIVAGRQLSYMYYRQECTEEEKQSYIERAKKIASESKVTKQVPTTSTKHESSEEEGDSSGETDDSEIQEHMDLLEEGEEEELAPPASVQDIFNLVEVVPKLVNLICDYIPEDRVKFRAVIQLIYHLALHDKFNEARDLLFMTHLQDKIVKAKPPIQVLYNRALVQLGFSAFRQGKIVDSHNCLQEIVSSNRARELLAQGISTSRYQQEKTKEQEKQEQRRQIPYHMHINIELLDCIYLASAMLLEVPNLAQSFHHRDKRKNISKHFLKCLQQRENSFNGPPENNKDIIIAAAKYLQQGNWKKCRDDILNLSIWQVMRNNQGVFQNLAVEIQEQGLRTYLLSYGQYYTSLSLAELCSLFELSEGDVRGIINKMIINEEFYASWDQLSDSIIVNSTEPTQLQSLALTYADKMNSFLESAETTEHRAQFERKWEQQQQQGQTGRFGMKKPGTPQYKANVFVTRDKKGKTRPVGTQESASTQFSRPRKY